MNFKKDFPVFAHDPQFIYFDSAATTQKPLIVMERLSRCYQTGVANIHRSTHRYGQVNTIEFEKTRQLVATFINADKNEIIFTHNCTDALNLVSDLLKVTKADEVVCPISEHHSNYLPWHNKANLKTLRLNGEGIIDLCELESILAKRPKVLTLSYVSNVTGNIQPVKEAINIAKKYDVITVIDAAQAIGHFPIDVSELGCDFLAFSGHKMLGPSGVGVLYAHKDAIKNIIPTRLGGGMMNRFEEDKINFKSAPHGFEAGTPNIEGVIAFGQTIEYFYSYGFHTIEAYLNDLESYFRERLENTPFIKPVFPINKLHVPIFSLSPLSSKIDLHELGRMFSDDYHIALSVGVQCCQPLYHTHGLERGLRVSPYLYNTKEDIDRFFEAVVKMKNWLT